VENIYECKHCCCVWCLLACFAPIINVYNGSARHHPRLDLTSNNVILHEYICSTLEIIAVVTPHFSKQTKKCSLLVLWHFLVRFLVQKSKNWLLLTFGTFWYVFWYTAPIFAPKNLFFIFRGTNPLAPFFCSWYKLLIVLSSKYQEFKDFDLNEPSEQPQVTDNVSGTAV
jgi:hypothetical protein